MLKIFVVFLLSFNVFAADYDFDLRETRDIDFAEDVVGVTIGKKGVVQVKETGAKNTLKITGTGIGAAPVTIKLRSGKVEQLNIVVSAEEIDVKALAARLDAIKGVKVVVKEGKAYVSGEISSPTDGAMFENLYRKFSKQIVDSTSKPYENKSQVTVAINTALNNYGFGNYRAKKYGRYLVLEGMKKNNADHQFALRIARNIDSSIEDGATEGKGGQTVSVDVLFLSYSNDEALNLGLLDPAQSANLASIKMNAITKTNKTGLFNWAIGPFSNVLRLMETITNKKVLSNPKLFVRSGESASFHTGNTKYLESSVRDTQTGEVTKTFVPIDAGLILNVTPIADRAGQVDIKLNLESSTFSEAEAGSSSGDAIPDKNTSRTETAMTIRNGYSVVLTGFSQQSASKTIKKIPFLGDIPIIGEIFKSRDFSDEKTNILVVLTVRAVNTDEDYLKLSTNIEETKVLPGEFKALDAKSSEDVSFSIFD